MLARRTSVGFRHTTEPPDEELSPESPQVSRCAKGRPQRVIRVGMSLGLIVSWIGYSIPNGRNILQRVAITPVIRGCGGGKTDRGPGRQTVVAERGVRSGNSGLGRDAFEGGGLVRADRRPYGRTGGGLRHDGTTVRGGTIERDAPPLEAAARPLSVVFVSL